MDKETVFNENLNLVPHTIKKALNISINEFDFEDIMQEGYIALWKCIDKFDESKGYAFTTYACACIKNHLISYLGSNGRKVAKKAFEDSYFLNNKIKDNEDGERCYIDLLEDTKNKHDSALLITLEDFLKDRNLCSEVCANVFVDYLNGLKIREIMKKRGLTKNVVTARLWKAKRDFREYLEREE